MMTYRLLPCLSVVAAFVCLGLSAYAQGSRFTENFESQGLVAGRNEPKLTLGVSSAGEGRVRLFASVSGKVAAEFLVAAEDNRALQKAVADAVSEIRRARESKKPVNAKLTGSFRSQDDSSVSLHVFAEYDDKTEAAAVNLAVGKLQNNNSDGILTIVPEKANAFLNALRRAQLAG